MPGHSGLLLARSSPIVEKLLRKILGGTGVPPRERRNCEFYPPLPLRESISSDILFRSPGEKPEIIW